jgi:hypothetical protein
MTWLRHLTALSLLCPLTAATAVTKPDAFQVEYETFRPTLYFGLHEGPDAPTFTTIRSERDWREFWPQIETRMARDMDQRDPHPLPPIDFTRQILLVAALGMKPTGGFSVSIRSVVEDSSRITVNVVAVSPGKNCMVTLTTTNPIALILIAKTSKPVQFSTTRAELPCD